MLRIRAFLQLRYALLIFRKIAKRKRMRPKCGDRMNPIRVTIIKSLQEISYSCANTNCQVSLVIIEEVNGKYPW